MGVVAIKELHWKPASHFGPDQPLESKMKRFLFQRTCNGVYIIDPSTDG